MNLIQNNIWNLQENNLGYMPYYIYSDCVYFEYMNDTPNEHHNNFILNQIPYFHITSSFKLMDDIFESLL